MKLLTRCFSALFVLTALLMLTGCQPKPGDKIKGLTDLPADAKAVLKDPETKTEITLPDNVRKKLIETLQGPATFVDYSQVTAQPNATIQVGNYTVGWYGSTIIQGADKAGHSWNTPFTQAFMTKFGYDKPVSTAQWNDFIKSLDK